MKKISEKKSGKKLITSNGNVNKPSQTNTTASIKKQYLKSNGSCNVTFRLPKDAAPDAQVVTLVGEFNNWSLNETEMKKLKSGDFKVTLKLLKNKAYKFRYLIDAKRWENDWSADQYVPNAFGCDDSLVIV